MAVQKSRLKNWGLNFLTVVIGLMIALAGLELVMRFLPVRDSFMALPVNAANPIIHYPPHSSIRYSLGSTFQIVQDKKSNNYGFLDDHDYVPTTKPLMVLIGDSFIEAQQVANQATAQALVQQQLGGRGRFYGIGIQSSPLSQYLAFAQFARQEFQPGAMAFSIVANDFDESLLKYRQLSSPGMHLFTDTSADAHLQLLEYDGHRENVRDLLRHSALVRYLYLTARLSPGTLLKALPFNKEAEAAQPRFGGVNAEASAEKLADSHRVVDLFFQYLPEKSGLPADKIVFVLDGMREVRSETMQQAADSSYFGLMRQYFAQIARQRGYEVVDMHPVFYQAQQDGQTVDFVPLDWHWNENGHKLVAGEIQKSGVFQQLFKQ